MFLPKIAISLRIDWTSSLYEAHFLEVAYLARLMQDRSTTKQSADILFAVIRADVVYKFFMMSAFGLWNGSPSLVRFSGTPER